MSRPYNIISPYPASAFMLQVCRVKFIVGFIVSLVYDIFYGNTSVMLLLPKIWGAVGLSAKAVRLYFPLRCAIILPIHAEER